jgi:hypothetical protein
MRQAVKLLVLFGCLERLPCEQTGSSADLLNGHSKKLRSRRSMLSLGQQTRARSGLFKKGWGGNVRGKRIEDFAAGGQMQRADATPLREDAVLDRIAVAVITSDKTIKTKPKYVSLMKRNFGRFKNFIIYSDSITQYDTEDGLPPDLGTKPMIKPCCGTETHLGKTLHESQYKLEKTLADFYALFPQALFFVYSDHDVWWNPSVIATQLGPLMARAKNQEFIVSGAGGYPGWPNHLICGCGAIVSRGMMQYISREKSVAQAREALISGQKWVPGKKAGALYNNDHLLVTLFEQAPRRVYYKSSEKLYMFNAWWSSTKKIMRAVANLLEDQPDTCGKGLEQADQLEECAKYTVANHIMAIHHITVEDHLLLTDMHDQENTKFPAGMCECNMDQLFGSMLPYFMRYGASPWNQKLDEWGMWHLKNMLPCGM